MYNLAYGATATVELVGGYGGPVTLDSDLDCVLRVEDKDTQTIKFVATKGDETVTKTFSISGMTLETEE